jgi:hypothetical protein
MNALLSPWMVRSLVLLAIGLGCLSVFAGAASAAPPSADAAASVPILQANFFYELVSDRARLIQISLVIVAFGCAIMWWYKW